MAVNDFAYRFGEFHLIPSRRELWCSDQLARIQPKVLDTLTYLVQNRDRAVGSDELIAAVWGRVDVTDNVLGQIVGRARRAVGDNGESQHSIRTVPRFGFRWVREVEVTTIDAETPAGEIVTHPLPQSALRNSWLRRNASVAMLVPLSLAGLIGWAVVGRHAATVPSVLTGAEAVTGSEAERLQQLHAALASNQLDKARALFRTLSDQQRIQPEVRYQAAELALKEGRFSEALNAFVALLADLGQDGPATLVGSSLYGAGLAELRQNRLDLAQQHLEQAIPVLTKAGPTARVTLGLAWSNLGRLHSTREAFDDAERAYAKARAVLEATGDSAALASLESNVGVTLIGRYRYAEALPRFQRAADLAAQTEDVNAEARARMNLVNAHLVLLQPADALESEPRLRALRERIGDPVLGGHADLVRAKALIANGRLREAALALQANASRPTPDNPTLAAERNVVSADLSFAQGALEASADQLRSLLALPWSSLGDDGTAAYARWRLFEASKAQGSEQGIAEAVAASEALRRIRPNEPTVGLYAALARAEVADQQGDTAQARSEFERALAQAETTRVPFDLVRAVASYARFLLRHGDVTGAGAVANHIAEWSTQDYSASLVRLGVGHAIGGEAWATALARTRHLAGERTIPAALTTLPAPTPPPLKGAEFVAVRGP